MYLSSQPRVDDVAGNTGGAHMYKLSKVIRKGSAVLHSPLIAKLGSPVAAAGSAWEVRWIAIATWAGPLWQLHGLYIKSCILPFNLLIYLFFVK